MNHKTMKTAKIIFFAYLAAMTVMCLFGALVPANNNTWGKGATIYYPDNHAVVGLDFMVNGSAYHEDGVEAVSLIFEPSGERFLVEQEKITHDGETLLTLSTFKTPVSLLKSGEYAVNVEVISEGKPSIIETIEFSAEEGKISNVFTMFSIDHLLALGAVLVIFIIMLLVYKKSPTPSKRLWLYAIVSLSVIACDIVLKAWMLNKGVFRGSYDMILHMCDISGFLTPVLCFMADSKLRKRLYNLMFIWGLGGALMALLTPEMGGYAFPSFYFFNFFIKHGTIVIAVLLVTFIDGYRPRLKQLPSVMMISIGIVGIIYAIDRLIVNIPPYEPGNYMFLSYPPTGGSAIDMLVNIFGPSPYYIIGLILLAMVIFIILWMPFAIFERIKGIRHKS